MTTASNALKRAILQDIIEQPDDDTPRLVYADWLDEYGDSADRDRAEFIRTQIALAREPAQDPWERQAPESDRVLRNTSSPENPNAPR